VFKRCKFVAFRVRRREGGVNGLLEGV